MIAKVGLGVLGVGVCCVGGIAITKPNWLGLNFEPDWKPLFKDSDFDSKKSSEYGTSKFGGKYKNYLVGADEVNKDWWEWSFKRLKKDSESEQSKPGNEFKYGTGTNDKVTQAFAKDDGENKDKALNQVCKKVYKAENSKVKAEGNGNDEYKENDVWKYCSALGGKPSTVKTFDHADSKTLYTDSSQIGKAEEDNLISVNDPKNKKFWNIRNQEIKENDKFDKITVNDGGSYFSNTNNKSIYQLCSEAYNMKTTTSEGQTSTNPTKEHVKKYCSLSIG